MKIVLSASVVEGRGDPLAVGAVVRDDLEVAREERLAGHDEAPGLRHDLPCGYDEIRRQMGEKNTKNHMEQRMRAGSHLFGARFRAPGWGSTVTHPLSRLRGHRGAENKTKAKPNREN